MTHLEEENKKLNASDRENYHEKKRLNKELIRVAAGILPEAAQKIVDGELVRYRAHVAEAIQYAESQETSHLKEIAELTKANSSLKSEAGALKNENASLKNQLDSLKKLQKQGPRVKDLEQKDEEAIQLRKRLELQNAQISNLKKEIKKLKRKTFSLINTHEEMVTKTTADQKQCSEQLGKIKIELASEKSKHQKPQDNFGRAARLLREKEKECHRITTELASTEWRLSMYKVVGDKGGLTRSRHLITMFDFTVNTAGIMSVHGGQLELDLILYLFGHISMANKAWFQNAYLVSLDTLPCHPSTFELLKISPKLMRMRNYHGSIHLDLRNRIDPRFEQLRADLERFLVLLEQCRSAEMILSREHAGCLAEMYAAFEASQENDERLDEMGKIVSKVHSERPRRLE